MGCDIHIYTEVKKEGKWRAIQVPNGWKKYLEGCLERATKQDSINYYKARLEEEPDKVYEGIYSGRNYDLFAILANVRNKYGFRPISMPKGLPEDISETVKLEAEEWAGDGHSHSYHTLQDLLDYDWKQETKHRGWVDEKTYKNFKETGNPYPHSREVSGMNVVHLTNKQMDDLIAGKVLRQEGKRYYTQIEWKETYEESAGNFVSETIPALQTIAEEHGVSNDEVRIVFWFDS